MADLVSSVQQLRAELEDEHRLRVEAESAWGRWQRRAEKAEADVVDLRDQNRRFATQIGNLSRGMQDTLSEALAPIVAERDALAARVAAAKAVAARLDGFAESTISVPDTELYSTLAAEIRKAVEVDHG